MIRQRLEKHKEKLRTEHDNKEQNIGQIKKWIDEAQSMNDVELEISLLLALGQYYKSKGDAEKALTAYQNAEQVYQQSEGSTIDLIRIKSNIANIMIEDFLQYQQGVDQYQEIVNMAHDMPPEKALLVKLQCYCNISHIFIRMNQYENAIPPLKHFWEHWEDPLINTVDRTKLGKQVCIARRAQAMVHIINGDYTQAHNEIRLLHDISKQLENHSYIITGYLILITLALRDPNHTTDPQDYWQQADMYVDGLLKTQDNSLHAVAEHSYEAGADQFAYLKHDDWAQCYREKARMILAHIQNET